LADSVQKSGCYAMLLCFRLLAVILWITYYQYVKNAVMLQNNYNS